MANMPQLTHATLYSHFVFASVSLQKTTPLVFIPKRGVLSLVGAYSQRKMRLLNIQLVNIPKKNSRVCIPSSKKKE
jgi:hypothetical protein